MHDCTLPGSVHFHLDLIRQTHDVRPLRLLVEGEDICPAGAASGPFVNAAGLLVLAFVELRGAPPWAGSGLAKSGFERHCVARDPITPDRCMGTLSALAHCTQHPWCNGSKWWLLRHLRADDLATWRRLPGVWTNASQPSGATPDAAVPRTLPGLVEETAASHWAHTVAVEEPVLRREIRKPAEGSASPRIAERAGQASLRIMADADADAASSHVKTSKGVIPRAMNVMPPERPRPPQRAPSPPSPPPLPPVPEEPQTPSSPEQDNAIQEPQSARSEERGNASEVIPTSAPKFEFQWQSDEAERAEACRQTGLRAIAEAEPLVDAWLDADARAAAEAAESALDGIHLALKCNPKSDALWSLYGVLLHMHRRVPLASMLTLRHAVELNPLNTRTYAELGLITFDQLLFGDRDKMSEMARLAQRSLLAVRQLRPELEDHILRQSRGGRRLIGLASPSMHMHVLLGDARARRKDIDNFTHLAPSISAAHRKAVQAREVDEYGALAKIHKLRHERREQMMYQELQTRLQEAAVKAEAAMEVLPTERPFDYERVEDEMKERVTVQCLKRPMRQDGIYSLCLNANATHVNYNLGEVLPDGRLPQVRETSLGNLTQTMRGSASFPGRDPNGPLVVQLYEGAGSCGRSTVRVHFYCGRRLNMMRAEGRGSCAWRMNVSLPLLCTDEKARNRPLKPPKKSVFYDYERHLRPKSAWDQYAAGEIDHIPPNSWRGPAFFAPLPPPIDADYLARNQYVPPKPGY